MIDVTKTDIYRLTYFYDEHLGHYLWHIGVLGLARADLHTTIAASLLILIWGRKKLAQQPILAFFLVSCLLAVLLFIGWGLYWNGFPQFSDVGLI